MEFGNPISLSLTQTVLFFLFSTLLLVDACMFGVGV